MFADSIATLVDGATVTPTASAWQIWPVASGTVRTLAAFPVLGAGTGEITIEVSNVSGGVMGVITWPVLAVFQGLTWVNPANTKKRNVRFAWNGSNWIAIAMSTADY